MGGAVGGVAATGGGTGLLTGTVGLGVCGGDGIIGLAGVGVGTAGVIASGGEMAPPSLRGGFGYKDNDTRKYNKSVPAMRTEITLVCSSRNQLTNWSFMVLRVSRVVGGDGLYISLMQIICEQHHGPSFA